MRNIPSTKPCITLMLSLALGFYFITSIKLVSAQSNFVASELPLNIANPTILRSDMDGDGATDILLTQWQQETGRELLIYLQQSNGQFLQQASRRIEIKTEIIAIALADIRPQPGTELLLFTSNGVFSLDTAIDGYSGNIKQLINWSMVADVPNRKTVAILDQITDMNDDGYLDLLIPGSEGYGFFQGGPNESFVLTSEFSTINAELDPAARPNGSGEVSASLVINKQEGIVLDISAGVPSTYEGLVTNWQGSRYLDREEKNSMLLRTSNLMPAARSLQMSSDNRLDISFLNIGTDIRGQLNVLLQDDNGGYSSSEQWQGSIDTKGQLMLMEFGGDAMVDLLKVEGRSKDWSVHFFENKDGEFNLEQPDQLMKFSGYDLDVKFLDLNNDKAPDLWVSFYTIPVLDVLRNASVIRTQLLFRNKGTDVGEHFDRRPDFKLEERFSASSIDGLITQMELEYDVDGDGRRDALYLTEDGVLAAKAISDNLQISDEPFWQYVPNRTIVDFTVDELNNDGIPDIILRHVSATTILVSSKIN